MTLTQLLGLAGSILVIAAYLPQIWHLHKEKCTSGVSSTSWVIWLAATLLFLAYALSIGDTVFTALYVINLIAILSILILLHANKGRVCASCRNEITRSTLAKN